MRYPTVALFFLLVTTGAFANTDFRDLLLQAMKSPTGSAKAEITGPVADTIRATIKKPKARVLANVTTVGNLPQEGCRRLNIQFTTPGTPLPMADGKNRPLDISMKLNLCENGQPPAIDGVEPDGSGESKQTSSEIRGNADAQQQRPVVRKQP